MNIRKIKIGVRDDIVDRADPSLLSKTGNGWSNVEYTIDQLISHIKKGHPVTHQFIDGKKKKDYFLRTDLLFADIDKGMTIDEALDNDLIKNFASFIYTTPRHSSDAHRFRVIFVLDRTIFSSDAYEAMYRSLLTKIPTDPNTASSAQFFNGCTTTQIYPIGKTLSEEQMNTMVSEGMRKYLNDVTHPIHETLTPGTLVKVKNKGLQPLNTLLSGKSIHCPFGTHEDSTPSAFVKISSAGIHGVECRSCGHDAWSQPLPTKDHFGYFDKIVNEYANSPNTHFQYEGLAQYDHDLECSMGKSNFHLTNTNWFGINDPLPGIHLIKSPKGTGKTHALTEIVNSFKQERIRKKFKLKKGRTVLIGHRQTLIRESAQKLGLECYLDTGDYDTKGIYDPNKGNIIDTMKPKYYAICLDSLHSRIKLRYEKYDVVIIDESEQVFAHLLSEHMAHPTSNFDILSGMIKKAKFVFCLDADLDQITLSGVMSCLSYGRDSKRDSPPPSTYRHFQSLYCHLNQYKTLNQSIEVFVSKNQLSEDLRANISKGKRCFVTSNSKKFIGGLYHSFSGAFPNKKFKLVVSDMGDDADTRKFMQNIRTDILEIDALFSSPSIGTGIDITFPNQSKDIDVVYGFFDTNVNTHFDIDQQIARVRHPGAVKVWVSPARQRFSTNTDKIRQELLSDDRVKGLRYYLDNNGAHASSGKHPFTDLLATVISARRLSMNNLKVNFIEHKKKTGWNVINVEHIDPLALRGSIVNKASRVVRSSAVTKRLIDAPDTTWKEIKQLESVIQKNQPLTDNQKAGSEKYWIENFYDQDITEDLILFDDGGKMRDKIRILEAVINPNLKHTNFAQILTEVSFLVGFSIKIDTLKKVVFIRELLEAAGLFDMKSFSLKTSKVYGTGDLLDFVNFIKTHSERYALLFNKEINDHLDQRPANQVNSILKIVGLKHKSVKVNKGGGVSTFMIDTDTYKTITDMVKRRNDKSLEKKKTLLFQGDADSD